MSSEYSVGIMTGISSTLNKAICVCEPQGLFIIVPWAAVASTRLVVCIQVSPLDANYMSALSEVKKDITWSTSGLTLATRKVFWKNQTFPSLSRSEKLVMAIVTVLAVQTVMAIVTLLAIETVMAIVTALAIETDMAIMILLAIETDMVIVTALVIETNMAIETALAIEIDIHGYCDRPSHRNQHGYCDRTSH